MTADHIVATCTDDYHIEDIRLTNPDSETRAIRDDDMPDIDNRQTDGRTESGVII